MTVVDASTVVAYCLHEEGWDEVATLLRERPYSVDLLSLECANALLMAKRRKRVSADEVAVAYAALSTVTSTAVEMVPHAGLLDASWELAERYGVTVYDAVYIALAKRMRTALASRDERQSGASKKAGVRVIEI